MCVNVEACKARLDQLAASSDVLGNKFRLIFEDNLTNFFTDLISGAKSFKSAFLDMARGIEQAITRIVAQNLAQSLFGNSGLFGGNFGGTISKFVGSVFGSMFGLTPAPASPAGASLPGRATGGDVLSNQPYWVGEKGPEVFVPKGAGYIVPTERLAALANMAAAGAMGPVGLWKSLASLPARANGGDVMPNQPYLVGERGPEVFLPQTAGAITPYDRLARQSGSSVVINNQFAPGTDLRTIEQAANLIGLRVQRAMRRST